MKRPPTPRRVSPIGLDFSPAEIRMVQVIGTPDQFEIFRSAVIPRRGPIESWTQLASIDAEALAGTLFRRGFSGDRVTIAAPREACSTHLVDLPARDSNAPVDAIARAEVGRAKRCDPGSFELAAWYLPSRGRGEQGVAVACDRTQLESRITSLEAIGLRVVGVDLVEWGLCRTFGPLLAAEPESVHAVVQVGWASTTGVLTIGGRVVYTRQFSRGISNLFERLCGRTTLSSRDAAAFLDTMPDDADGSPGDLMVRRSWASLGKDLAAELDTAVTYVTHMYRSAPVGSIFLSGYGADRAELAGEFDRVMGMPVHRADTSRGGHRLELATGLAGRFDA